MRWIFRLILLAFTLGAACGSVAAQSSQPMYIYVPNGGNSAGVGVFSAFKIDPSTGALTVVEGSPYEAGGFVLGVAVDPAGRYVYVLSDPATGAGPNGLFVFSVDQTTGVLTAIPGSPFPGAGNSIAIDPTGRFLYTGSLSVDSLDPVSGAPTPTSGSPFPVQNGAYNLTIDPNGNYIYFQTNTSNPEIYVTTESLDFESGTPTLVSSTLVEESAGTTYPGLAVDPLARFIAVNGTGIYTLDYENGSVVSPGPPIPALSGQSVFDGTGSYLYAQVEYCASLQVPCGAASFQVNPFNGTLTQITTFNFGGGALTSPIVDPTDHFVYGMGGNPGGGGVGLWGYSLNQSTGALTPLAGSPWPMSYANEDLFPMAIAFAPTGISNPVPSITSFSPASITAAGPAFTLTVNGSNFVPGARVYYGGRGRVTTYVNSTQLTASLYPSDIAYGGSGVVFVYNPLPGGGASDSAEFPVIDPSPNLTSISTTTVVAGGSGFTLTLTGTSFQPISVVTVNGTPLTTTFVNYYGLQAPITAAQVAIPGTLSIGVTTPPINGLGGGSSGTLPLAVTPLNLPPPVISQLGPGSTTAGGPALPLLITGTGFTSSSVVTFGGTNVAVTNFTTSTSFTTLTVTIPATAITSPGIVPVVVSTAAGVSPPVTFYVLNPPPTAGGVNPPVVPAGAAALTLNVSGSGFTSASTVLVNGSSRVTIFVSATMLQAALLASDISHGGTLTITVSTPGPGGGISAPITLTVADYAVSVGSSASAISAGQSANYTLTVAPSNGAYANPVTFTVTTALPAGAAASFSPSATITPGSTSTNVTLSISTTARSLLTSGQPRPWPWSGIILMWLAGLALILAGISLSESQSSLRLPATQFLFVVALLMAAGMTACSSGSAGTSTTPTNPSTGTPAGTYSLVVTATSGADVHTTTVTLTVM